MNSSSSSQSTALASKDGSDNARALASAFASAVTVHSDSDAHWIAKNGPESLFSAFSRILPQACQDKSGRHRAKSKIASAEFNKLLATECGFCCARSRKRHLSRAAGNWLFSHRRWLNPANAGDHAVLDHEYGSLCERFPVFAKCPKEDFMQSLLDITFAWALGTKEEGNKPIKSLADHAPVSSHRKSRKDQSGPGVTLSAHPEVFPRLNVTRESGALQGTIGEAATSRSRIIDDIAFRGPDKRKQRELTTESGSGVLTASEEESWYERPNRRRRKDASRPFDPEGAAPVAAGIEPFARRVHDMEVAMQPRRSLRKSSSSPEVQKSDDDLTFSHIVNSQFLRDALPGDKIMIATDSCSKTSSSSSTAGPLTNRGGMRSLTDKSLHCTFPAEKDAARCEGWVNGDEGLAPYALGTRRKRGDLQRDLLKHAAAKGLVTESGEAAPARVILPRRSPRPSTSPPEDNTRPYFLRSSVSPPQAQTGGSGSNSDPETFSSKDSTARQCLRKASQQRKNSLSTRRRGIDVVVDDLAYSQHHQAQAGASRHGDGNQGRLNAGQLVDLNLLDPDVHRVRIDAAEDLLFGRAPSTG